MIYITGDTHGDAVRFIENNMEDANWTEGDVLIICGDFGFVFTGKAGENANLDYLETKPTRISPYFVPIPRKLGAADGYTACEKTYCI